MATADEGLKSDPLKQALADALMGDSARLEDLLARHGGLPGPRPNLKLAAAFGAELAACRENVVPLLRKLERDEAPDDKARAFLPVAAAHGWAARIRVNRDVNTAWGALADMALDERVPVLQGLKDALLTLAVRQDGGDLVLENAAGWLELDDREARYAASALALDVLADSRVMASIADTEALFAYLSRVLEEMESAPRSAERSVFRRRTLAALTVALPSLIAHGGAGEPAVQWLQEECARAERIDVRQTLSDSIVRLRGSASGQRGGVVDSLAQALEASAKPLRHAARVRPGTGRGKKTRSIR